MATIYVERRVRSAPGLSQEDALESLQAHSNYKPGTKISSIRRRGDRWVADLLIPKNPKTAEFPPDEGGDEPKPKDDGPPKDEGPEDGPDEGPPGLDSDGDFDGDDEGDGPPKEKEPKGEEMVVHLLTEILHALKGGPAGPELGGPDDLGPGPDAMGPPPHGGHGLPPAGPPKPGAAGIGAKLKPGEVPNKPGVVPIGAPAFSHTHPLAQRIAKIAGRQRHIPVSSPAGMTIKQAKAELDPIAEYFGYRVAQIRYCGPNCSCKHAGSSKIHALLEVE